MATFTCPSCHKSVRIEHANPEGQRFRCNHCQTVFRATAPKQPAATAAPAKEKSAAAPAKEKSAAPAAKEKPAAPAEVNRPSAITAKAAPQALPKLPKKSLDDDDDEDAPDNNDDWAGADFLKASTAPAEKPADSETELAPAPKKWPLKIKLAIAAAGLLALAGAIFFIGKMFEVVEVEIPETAWAPYRPPSFHCQVDMPGEVLLMPGNLGMAKEFGVERKERSSKFTITHLQIPGNNFNMAHFDDLFRSQRDKTEEFLVARVQNQRSFRYLSYPASEFMVMDIAGRMCAQRWIWVPGDTFSRVYVLTVHGRFPDADHPAPKRFFESLKLPPRPVRLEPAKLEPAKPEDAKPEDAKPEAKPEDAKPK